MQEEFEEQEAPETPPAETVAPPQPSAEELKTRQERDQLREENRRLHARSVAREHGLPDSLVDLLAGVPKDQQEAKAKEIAESLPQAQQQPPLAQEPPEAEQLKQMDTPPGGPPAQEPSAEDVMLKRLQEAKSHEDIVRIHEEEIAKARGLT